MKKAAFLVVVLFVSLKTVAQGITESPILLKTLSGTIAGTLAMPKNGGDKVPLVLIVGDFGPTDRDGNNPKAGIKGNTYKLLAQALGESGIATLRYDKRGAGSSVTVTEEKFLRIDDYSDDVVSLINMLADDKRFSKIILLGHGEGSIVSLISMIDQPIAAFISIEGAGEPADKLLVTQMKDKPKFLIDEFQEILDSLRKGKTTDKVDPSLYYIARPNNQRFLMSWCRCIPQKGIKLIKKPILIIQGTTDLLIATDNGQKLKKAKSDAIYLEIKDMNHVLREAPADEEKNLDTYNKPDLPLKPEMVKGVIDFVTKLK